MRDFAYNRAVADSLLTVGYRNKSRLLSISFPASHTDLLTTKSKQFTCSCIETISRSALTKPDNKIIFTILIVVLYQKTCGRKFAVTNKITAIVNNVLLFITFTFFNCQEVHPDDILTFFQLYL